ncbi:serine hydrolase domain-containing protein [Streptomyces buecherae]|uniref:serine hydrolase domain-containing protein n=1 Tax=Streptomyces buecherae TaxID=2763006 RepID=UPI001C26E657|nr:serine hydrolase domain-containing protein [Streptomyces buecherae]
MAARDERQRDGAGPAAPGTGRPGPELTDPPARAATPDRGQLTALVREVAALPAGERPWCAGVVVLAGQGDRTLVHEAFGWAVRYAAYDEATDRGVELPVGERVPMRADTVFDLASLTKLCTALVAVGAAERGAISLERPAAAYAPELTAAAAHGITVRQLLTHTSGLRPELPLYALPAGPADDPAAARWAAVAREAPLTAPGGPYRYSDLNMLLLQRVLERATGRPLDALVREMVTGPLGMRRTRFVPPATWRPNIAATEDQRAPWGKLDRGPVHGVVHDENAYALGGVAGHAGLFAPAGDLEILCQALLAGGVHRGTRVLAPESVAALLAPPGLGFAVDQPWFMGELAGRGAAGHTGFTGTSLVLDRATGGYLVLLANTVHPRRRPADNGPRVAAASRLARALGARRATARTD